MDSRIREHRLPSVPFSNIGKDGRVNVMLHYIKAGICPFCNSRLKVDIQEESVFNFCDNCSKFDASIHMDVETKEVLLGYSSILGDEGIMEPAMLEAMAGILLRKNYFSF